MDVSLAPGPILAYSPPDNKSHFIFDYKWWLEVGSNTAVAVSGGLLLTRASMFARSVALLPNVPTLVKWSLPFQVSFGGRGILLFALDVGFYKGLHPGFKLIQEQYRLLTKWLDTVDDSALRNAMGPFEYEKFAGHGQLASFTALIYMPPAWLSDP